MNDLLGKAIANAASQVFMKLLTDEELHKQVALRVEDLYHTYQVKSGQVNLHSQEKAITISLKTCLRKDQESQEKVAAFVTGLYLQHRIERAAQVGGSLLKRFGKSWFPHIQDRELKFALEVDAELEMYLLKQIKAQAINFPTEN
ncbi:MAG: hypothetical protein MH825_16505 [Cyanobacteria bacterium]|nr:hypothetical protein [Cyanobacteriota bacterium]